MSSIATLSTGTAFHYLDHIAPLAWHLEAPLIVSERKTESLAAKYYPFIPLECIEDLEFKFASLARFDTLIECRYWRPHFKPVFETLHGKKIDLIFCPHGQSDKGFGAPSLAYYAQQDAIFFYGDLHADMLQKLDLWDSIPRKIRLGDYRRDYYLAHKTFYDDLIEKEIFSSLPPNQPTLLYAPTWLDDDLSSSFFEQSERVFSSLPRSWNLIVKLHPFLQERHPAHYIHALERCPKGENFLLLEDFPLIHPLLARVDAYLGDFSSVGYDFLKSQRPMFFFPNDKMPKAKLRDCGLEIPDQVSLFSFLDKHRDNPFAEKQKQLYDYAYSLKSGSTYIPFKSLSAHKPLGRPPHPPFLL